MYQINNAVNTNYISGSKVNISVLDQAFFFVHLDQNSGPLKTQVFTETQGIFPKTQGISTQIGVILVIFGKSLAEIGIILPKLQKNPRKTQGKTLKTQVFGKAATAW